MKKIRTIIVLLVCCFFYHLKSEEVTLMWDKSIDPNAVGYVVYSVESGVTNSVVLGDTNVITISNLKTNANYYFFATAYDAQFTESLPSNILPIRSGSGNTNYLLSTNLISFNLSYDVTVNTSHRYLESCFVFPSNYYKFEFIFSPYRMTNSNWISNRNTVVKYPILEGNPLRLFLDDIQSPQGYLSIYGYTILDEKILILQDSRYFVNTATIILKLFDNIAGEELKWFILKKTIEPSSGKFVFYDAVFVDTNILLLERTNLLSTLKNIIEVYPVNFLTNTNYTVKISIKRP